MSSPRPAARAAAGGRSFASDHRFRFSSHVEEVWAAIGSVHRYREWWPWLLGFEGSGLVPGDRWDCEIRPPAPYRLRFVVAIDEVDPPVRIGASLSGDVRGEALVTLSPVAPAECDLRIASTLVPERWALRLVARAAPGLARSSHSRLLGTGARQFAARALGPGPARPGPVSRPPP